jgi:hypothetical protein
MGKEGEFLQLSKLPVDNEKAFTFPLYFGNKIERRTKRKCAPCKKVRVVFNFPTKYLLSFELKAYLCVSVRME